MAHFVKETKKQKKLAVEEDNSPKQQSNDILDVADVTFDVEGKDVKAVKGSLMVNSPVFKAMFTEDFKEKFAEKIPLPEKDFDRMVDFMELMHCCHTNVTDFDVTTLVALIPLAHEYQVTKLLKKMERRIIRISFPTNEVCYEENFDLVILADKYNLPDLRKKSIKSLSKIEFDEMTGFERIHEMERESFVELIRQIISRKDRTIKSLNQQLQTQVNYKRKYPF